MKDIVGRTIRSVFCRVASLLLLFYFLYCRSIRQFYAQCFKCFMIIKKKKHRERKEEREREHENKYIVGDLLVTRSWTRNQYWERFMGFTPRIQFKCWHSRSCGVLFTVASLPLTLYLCVLLFFAMCIHGGNFKWPRYWYRPRLIF